MRIVHLSDFHLGLPSRGARAVARGVAWAGDRDPDLVCITGDLVSRPRGEAKLRELLRTLQRCYAILGNHDIAISRDPFSKAVGLRGLEPARLLLDEGVEVEVRGERVWIAGLDPRSRGEEPAAASGRVVDNPPLALPVRARPPRRGGVRPRPRRAHARRPDLRAVPGREAAARASVGAVHARPLPARRDGHARHARPGNDVRAVSLLRPAGGDGARPAGRRCPFRTCQG